MEVPLIVKLGVLALLGVILTLRQQQQHRFWDDWDKRFKDECGRQGSSAESIPTLVKEMEAIRYEFPNPLGSGWEYILRLLIERQAARRRDNLNGSLLLLAFCLTIWIVWPFLIRSP